MKGEGRAGDGGREGRADGCGGRQPATPFRLSIFIMEEI